MFFASCVTNTFLCPLRAISFPGNEVALRVHIQTRFFWVQKCFTAIKISKCSLNSYTQTWVQPHVRSDPPFEHQATTTGRGGLPSLFKNTLKLSRYRVPRYSLPIQMVVKGLCTNRDEDKSQCVMTCEKQLKDIHAQHRYREGHGFESRPCLNSVFRLSFHSGLSCVHNCDDQLCLNVFLYI